jgi:hypothetical protein
MAVHAAVAVGVSHWLVRRLDAQSTQRTLDRLGGHVERLVVAHEALAEAVDRRLRSVEESAARAEAEARFTATLVGDHACPRPASTHARGDADGVDRPATGSVRPLLRPADDRTAGGAEARHVDG